MDEVLALKLDADWIVLLACNSAGGMREGADAMLRRNRFADHSNWAPTIKVRTTDIAPPLGSELSSLLDQANPLQILALVIVLLRDFLGVVLGREIEARKVETLEQLDHLRVVVCLLEGIVQLLDH